MHAPGVLPLARAGAFCRAAHALDNGAPASCGCTQPICMAPTCRPARRSAAPGSLAGCPPGRRSAASRTRSVAAAARSKAGMPPRRPGAVHSSPGAELPQSSAVARRRCLQSLALLHRLLLLPRTAPARSSRSWLRATQPASHTCAQAAGSKRRRACGAHMSNSASLGEYGALFIVLGWAQRMCNRGG